MERFPGSNPASVAGGTCWAAASVLPAPASGHPLSLAHEDAHCVVLHKPAGVLCVPGRGPDLQDCLTAQAQHRWPDARVVHRLDMATSGLWLMARGAAMQRAFSALFERREVDKRYLAVVAGHLLASALPRLGHATATATSPTCAQTDGWGVIELPLAADWPNRPRQQVDHERGKPSLTSWRVMRYNDAAGTTRLELAPVTGRSHQLRVHLQAIGHPILGDMLYAPPEVQAQAKRLLLHASALSLRHPATGEMLTLHSPAPF